MNDLERIVSPLEKTEPVPSRVSVTLRRGLQAVLSIYGDEWNRDFRESARSLHESLGTAVEPERKLAVFEEHFNTWCDKLVSIQDRMCGDLIRIAMANRAVIGNDLVGWLRSRVEQYWAGRRLGFRGWVAWGCGGCDLKRWSAPGWLLVPKDHLNSGTDPGGAPSEAHCGSVLQSNTQGILDWADAIIMICLFEAECRAIDRFEITLASGAARQLAPASATVSGGRATALQTGA